MDEEGTWWCYEAEPHQHDKARYENEVGKSCKITNSVNQNISWQNSLTNVR